MTQIRRDSKAKGPRRFRDGGLLPYYLVLANLDLDVHTSGKVEALKRVNRLG